MLAHHPHQLVGVIIFQAGPAVSDEGTDGLSHLHRTGIPLNAAHQLADDVAPADAEPFQAFSRQPLQVCQTGLRHRLVGGHVPGTAPHQDAACKAVLLFQTGQEVFLFPGFRLPRNADLDGDHPLAFRFL